jgi:hypothetical protein
MIVKNKGILEFEIKLDFFKSIIDNKNIIETKKISKLNLYERKIIMHKMPPTNILLYL